MWWGFFFCLLSMFAPPLFAQFPLAIPQIPPPPSLPLTISTNGAFVFSWTSWNPDGGEASLNPGSVPLEARSGVVKFGSSSWGGLWFIKTNGQVLRYTRSVNMTTSYNKLELPEFFSNNIVNLYRIGVPNPYHWIALSKTGQVGVMFDTNRSTFNIPTECSNVVEVVQKLPEWGGDVEPGFASRFLTLHGNGTLKAWQAEGGYITEIPHPTASLQDVRQVDGRADLGLALMGNGQVYGWSWNSESSQYSSMPIPTEASAGVVKIFAGASKTQCFYALRADGIIVCWDSNGNKIDLPPAISTEQFVGLINNISSTSPLLGFALTTSGQVVGWRFENGTSASISMEPQLQTGVVEIMGPQDPFTWSFYSKKQTGEAFIVGMAWEQPWEWGASSRIPRGIILNLPLESLNLAGGSGAPGEIFSISYNADLAVQTYAGLPLDLLAQLVAEKILNISNNYGIATKTEVSGAVSQGVQQVLSAPSEYNLFTTQQVQAERTAGQNDILANPNQWTLYTVNQIQNMAVGDLVLTRTNGGEFILNYEIEQSEDLVSWTPYQGFAMPLTNLPTNKAFVRLKTKN